MKTYQNTVMLLSNEHAWSCAQIWKKIVLQIGTYSLKKSAKLKKNTESCFSQKRVLSDAISSFHFLYSYLGQQKTFVVAKWDFAQNMVKKMWKLFFGWFLY